MQESPILTSGGVRRSSLMLAWLAARAVNWTIARRRRSIGRLMVSEAETRHFY